ncbi:GNAT family N-acetyltransferase [Prevotella sp. MGM2]|uniref:GNAT family N-acetyltransferase n=1 Tax=Prevotella sp. MGM2 TaxID=2033406 RepID=UPI000CEA0229|nr:GNAT family N-acetyltransferase [Prevotella sp. MGM2]GAY30826.1 N-acetyltransferase [Prevotella sp. MGM2]
MKISQFSWRKAFPEDLPRIHDIIEQAKQQMLREGKQQWNEYYPALTDLQEDVSSKHGYVLCQENGLPIAYGAVIIGKEPAYNNQECQWLSIATPYIVVHRLAVADEVRNKGIGTHFMLEVEQMAVKNGIASIRIDTNHDNGHMLRLLARLKFTRCGNIHYPKGGTRIAFEKTIAQQ